MKSWKPGLLVLAVFAGLSSSAQAQKVGNGSGYVHIGGYPGGGFNPYYDTIHDGFGNYGLPGAYPNYQGYGFSGYGPGSAVGGYYQGVTNTPKVTNNMGGLMNSIQRQTGKPGSYRINPGTGVSRTRRPR